MASASSIALGADADTAEMQQRGRQRGGAAAAITGTTTLALPQPPATLRRVVPARAHICYMRRAALRSHRPLNPGATSSCTAQSAHCARRCQLADTTSAAAARSLATCATCGAETLARRARASREFNHGEDCAYYGAAFGHGERVVNRAVT